MKYALLIHSNDEQWEERSENEQQAIYGEYMAISELPGMFGGAQLEPATSTTTVRVADGRTLATDGPFAETKEALGGDRERLLSGFLGQVEVSEEADQRGDDASPLVAEGLFEDVSAPRAV